MKFKNQILYFVSILTVALMTFSCSNDDTKDVVKLPSIVDIAKADPANFSILVDALKKTGLDITLGNPGSYTVFAPTNAAFTTAGITSASINALNPLVPADATVIANLKLVLQNHVIGVGTRTSDLLAVGYYKTFGYYKATAAATSGANLNIFFNKPATDILINGGAANGGAKITTADIDASNGVVHVIDAVLALPTIVNQIAANPSLTSLLGLVKSPAQATVLATLNAATGTAPVSVFAPTNDAFATALGTGGYLVGKTDADITKILNYHLEKSNRVAASTTAFSATADITVTTLFPTYTFVITKATLKIVDKSAPAVNANVKVLNIQGSNGSIQITDKVLQSL
ncbi:fasciclin domain-containing protein [Flavobacterium sp. M31R6]|uniref:fasciclin domain-containing protein n=1 Tax=Flavobacterium sp. M31R6 TaxID=2739062 RepID=UPI001568F83D|nr:fasciclin domain-containing protein [Flavobacterium sp. M31R6]QKJ61821.1 fasciclin domain-containing protein [Flavobacterium sp. M31R6]